MVRNNEHRVIMRACKLIIQARELHDLVRELRADIVNRQQKALCGHSDQRSTIPTLLKALSSAGGMLGSASSRCQMPTSCQRLFL